MLNNANIRYLHGFKLYGCTVFLLSKTSASVLKLDSYGQFLVWDASKGVLRFKVEIISKLL